MKVSGNAQDEVKKLKRHCEERRFDNTVKAHNRREKHIKPHEMLISSMQWQPEIHYGMTTVNDIMNIGRAINAGEITFYGTFGMCKNEVCLIGVRVEKRCDGTATVGFSMNPSESEAGMRSTFFKGCKPVSLGFSTIYGCART